MLLEGLAERHGPVAADRSLFRIAEGNELDLTALVPVLAAERHAGYGAALFHATLVAALAEWAARAAHAAGIATIAGGGGCFLNAILARELRAALADARPRARRSAGGPAQRRGPLARPGVGRACGVARR